MSIAAVLAWIVVVVWLTLTVIAQFSGMSQVVARYDTFHLVPRWTFFAPNPGVKDYHVAYRDKCTGGQTSSWRSIDVGVRRTFVGCVWHPQKRERKILMDSVQSLRVAMRLASEAPRAVEVSLPYLMLLRVVMVTPKADPGSVERQFVVVESCGHQIRDVQIAFSSSFHKFS